MKFNFNSFWEILGGLFVLCILLFILGSFLMVIHWILTRLDIFYPVLIGFSSMVTIAAILELARSNWLKE
jgi:uncharacterized membrane protein